MDVKTSNTALPSMTPAQQGVFFDLIKKQAPAWLPQSSDDRRNPLHKCLKGSFLTRRAALGDLQALKAPQAFCAPLLAKAISARLGAPQDVEGVVFQASISNRQGVNK